MASITIPAMTTLVADVERARTDVTGQRGRLRSTLEGVMVSTASTEPLGVVAAWLDGVLPGLRRRLQLAVALEASSPTALGVVTFDEAVVPDVPPAQAAADGRAAAAALLAAHGEVDEHLLALLEQGAADPYFAGAFATAPGMSPAALADAVLAVSRSRDALLARPGGTPLDDVTAFDARYQRLLDSLGTTVGTASRGTGELAVPGYAQQWARTLTGDPQEDGSWGRAGAAAVVLRQGVYDTAFLTSVAQSVLDAEADAPRGFWQARSTPPGTSSYLGVTLPGGAAAYDPLADVLVGLGHNPAAAQRFLATGSVDVDVPTSEGTLRLPAAANLEHLLLHRVWPTDDGAGLGAAILAATTHLRDDSAQGRTSARLAAQVVALAASRIGDGDTWIKDDGWQVPEGMREPVARMLAAYPFDLIDVVSTDHRTGSLTGAPSSDPWVEDAALYGEDLPQGLPPGARMDRDALARVLQSLGRSDDGAVLDPVVGSLLLAHDRVLDRGFERYRDEHPGAPLTMAEFRSSASVVFSSSWRVTESLAFVVTNGYQGGSAQEALDDAQREAFQKVFDTAVGFVPGPEDQIGAALFDEAKSRASGAIGDPTAGGAAEHAQASVETLKDALTRQGVDALLRHGYLDPAVDPEDGLDRRLVVEGPAGLQIAPGIGWGGSGPASPELRDLWSREVTEAQKDLVTASVLDPLATAFPQHFG